MKRSDLNEEGISEWIQQEFEFMQDMKGRAEWPGTEYIMVEVTED